MSDETTKVQESESQETEGLDRFASAANHKNFRGAVDKDGREINPDAYITTLNEARYIDRAFYCKFAVYREYLRIPSEKLKDPATQSLIRTQVANAYAKNHITRKRIEAIADKVFYEGQYWSYGVETVEFSSSDPTIGVATEFKVDSNIEGIDGIIFSENDHPGFFETDDPAEQAASLGIPDTIKYIPSFELFALRKVYGEHLTKLKKPQKPEPGFFTMPSDPLIDAFANMGAESKNRATLETIFDKSYYNFLVTGEVTISALSTNYDVLVAKNIDIDKLLVQAINTSFMQGYPSKAVIIPLDDIMRVQGRTDRKEAAKMIRGALEGLSEVTVSYDNPKTGSFAKVKLVQGLSYNAGKGHNASVLIVFTDSFFEYLKNNNTNVLYSEKLMKLNGRRGGYAYPLGKAFFINKRMNVEKKNENTISVRTLLSKCDITPYEKLKNKWQASQRIIDPFVKAMDQLEEEGILSWTFQLPGGGDIPPEDMESAYGDYKFFSTLMVKAAFFDEPDYSILRGHRKAVIEGRKKKALKEEINKPAKKRGRPKKQQ